MLREANQAINPKLLQLVEDRGSGRSRGRGGMKDDRRDRYSAGKRVALIPLETGKIMTEVTLVCLRETLGQNSEWCLQCCKLHQWELWK